MGQPQRNSGRKSPETPSATSRHFGGFAFRAGGFDRHRIGAYNALYTESPNLRMVDVPSDIESALPGRAMRQLTSSRVIIVLLPPLQMGGWFLPQLFTSRFVQRQPRRLPVYNLACVVRWLLWLLLTASVFALGPRRPQAMLALVLLGYTGYCLMGGVTGVTFMDLVAQGIDPRQRGTFFAWRQLTGGILAVAASVFVSRLIGPGAPLAFPYNFGLLTAVSLVVITVMFVSFSFWIETDHPLPSLASGSLPQSVRTILRCDRNLRGFLATRVLLIGGGMTMPFFVVRAAELGPPQQLAGLFLVVYTATELVSNLLWGWVSDQVSNKVVLGLVGGFVLAENLLAWAFQPHWPAALYLSIFALMGLAQSGMMICGLNLLLEIADPRERPVYVGLANTIMGAATLLLPLGGVVAQVSGLPALFALAAGLAAGALLSLAAWQDPRSPAYRRPRFAPVGGT